MCKMIKTQVFIPVKIVQNYHIQVFEIRHIVIIRFPLWTLDLSQSVSLKLSDCRNYCYNYQAIVYLLLKSRLKNNSDLRTVNFINMTVTVTNMT